MIVPNSRINPFLYPCIQEWIIPVLINCLIAGGEMRVIHLIMFRDGIIEAT
jgi:hypothetical protein